MFISFAICMGLVGHMTMAVPIENSSSDLASSPALAVENPSSNFTQYFESRVVGGTVARPGDDPHSVALVVGWHIKSFVCGASIMSSTCIVTAAHCLMLDWQGNILESSHGIAGTNTWNSGGVILEFKSHIIHPEYNPRTIKYDIAVVILEKPVSYTKKIQPIRMGFGWVGAGVQARVAGWGRLQTWGVIPDQLQTLTTTTLSAKECEDQIAIIAPNWVSIPPRDHKTELCTYISVGKGVCNGDSGSALTVLKKYFNKLVRIQIGVVVWGFPCAAGGPDVYIRVSSCKDFIIEAMRKCKGCNKPSKIL